MWSRCARAIPSRPNQKKCAMTLCKVPISEKMLKIEGFLSPIKEARAWSLNTYHLSENLHRRALGYQNMKYERKVKKINF